MVSFVLTPESSGDHAGSIMPFRVMRSIVVTGAMLAFAAPALAHGAQDHAPMRAPAAHQGYDAAAYEQDRADWLAECRRNRGSGNTVGGAVVGAVAGGLLGSAVAGRDSRTEGAVIGAVAGAAAGGALGSSADKRAARDYCESYLDRQTAGYGQAHGGYGYGYGYQPMMVMVPVMMAHAAPVASKPRDCEETVVTEEWVDVPRQRVIPPRPPKRAPYKRVPDKRVRTN